MSDVSVTPTGAEVRYVANSVTPKNQLTTFLCSLDLVGTHTIPDLTCQMLSNRNLKHTLNGV